MKTSRQLSNINQFNGIIKQNNGMQDLAKAYPPFPNRRRKKDAVFEEAGRHAIIGQRVYPKATLRAVLGVREPLAYFITGAAAHPVPI
jgi:hypothetical protein